MYVILIFFNLHQLWVVTRNWYLTCWNIMNKYHIQSVMQKYQTLSVLLLLLLAIVQYYVA